MGLVVEFRVAVKAKRREALLDVKVLELFELHHQWLDSSVLYVG